MAWSARTLIATAVDPEALQELHFMHGTSVHDAATAFLHSQTESVFPSQSERFVLSDQTGFENGRFGRKVLVSQAL